MKIKIQNSTALRDSASILKGKPFAAGLENPFKNWLSGLVASVCDRRKTIRPVPLANSLALKGETGIENLQIDPGSTVPIASKYLVYERGSAYNYARIAAGVNVPLGISADAPFQLGDYLEIFRFGAHKGFQIGIPGGAITVDHLVCVNTDGSGHVVDLTTLGNGTYWVIGRCKASCLATDIEVAFVPCTPYQLTVSNGGGTYAFAGAGV